MCMPLAETRHIVRHDRLMISNCSQIDIYIVAKLDCDSILFYSRSSVLVPNYIYEFEMHLLCMHKIVFTFGYLVNSGARHNTNRMFYLINIWHFPLSAIFCAVHNVHLLLCTWVIDFHFSFIEFIVCTYRENELPTNNPSTCKSETQEFIFIFSSVDSQESHWIFRGF